MIELDFSFERQGRTLAEWLPELVADSLTERNKAANAVGGMFMAAASYNAIRLEDYAEALVGVPNSRLRNRENEFAEAVRAAVAQRAFPTELFIRRLITYRWAHRRDFERRWKKGVPHLHGLKQTEPPADEDLASDDPDLRRGAAAQLDTAWRWQMAQAGETAEELPHLMGGLVFDALDDAFLSAPDLIREMLYDRNRQDEALRVLARLGSSAKPFAADLMRRLNKGGDWRGSGLEVPLANLAATDPALRDSIIDRLDAPGKMWVVTSVLERLGPAIGPRREAVLARLLELSHDPQMLHIALPALASVGRDRAEVADRVLELAQPRPPRLTHHPGYPQYEYDEVAHDRATAIESARFLTPFPDRIVPMLIDALDSFEEYDPDQEPGDHARVVESLRAFGDRAAAAVPALIRHIRGESDPIDWGVVRLLGSLGPAAAEALPALREIEAQSRSEPLMLNEHRHPDEEFEGLAWAIWRIAGRWPP